MSRITAQSTPTTVMIRSRQALIMRTQCNIANAHSLEAHKPSYGACGTVTDGALQAASNKNTHIRLSPVRR